MRISSLVRMLMVLSVCLKVSAHESLRPERTVALLEAAREQVRIVAFGDSITGIHYHTGSRRAWGDLLDQALKELYPEADIQMFNAGLSGNTSTQGLARIERDVIAHKPHLVVVMFGMNDCAADDLELFRKNMKEIVERCRAAGAEVVLCTQNNVYQNDPRPQERLAKYTEAIREVAAQMSVPLADSYMVFEAVQERSQTDWALLMSETIHPNMNGHRIFAETIAKTISGKPVSLDDAGVAGDPLMFTMKLLSEDKPFRVVAMQPYDKIVPEALQEWFPTAEIEVVTWPVEGKSLEEIESWARSVRGLQPNLVVFAVPDAAVSAEESTQDSDEEEALIRKYIWSLALCFARNRATHDVMVILPSVTNPVRESGRRWEGLARQIAFGYDVKGIERPVGSSQTAMQIVAGWIDQQVAEWIDQHIE